MKFGWVKNQAQMKRRLAVLQCGDPFVLESIAMVDGSIEDEKSVHEMLSKSWHRGEWFKLDTDVKRIIALMVEGKPFKEWTLPSNASTALRRVLWWGQNWEKTAGEGLRIRTRRAGEIWSFKLGKRAKTCRAKQVAA